METVVIAMVIVLYEPRHGMIDSAHQPQEIYPTMSCSVRAMALHSFTRGAAISGLLTLAAKH